MKKRKELDALLGKRCRSSQQLQTDNMNAEVPASSSSHDMYFHPAATYRVSPKRSGRSIKEKSSPCSLKRCFYFSLPLCLLTLIAACITSSVGVVWMQMQLKSDIDQIKERLVKLERWRNDEVSSLSDMRESVKSLETDLIGLKEGDTGIRSLQISVATLSQQMKHYSNSDISLFKKNLTNFNKSLITAESGLSNLKQKVESFEHSSEVNTGHMSNLRLSLDELHNKISALPSELNDQRLAQDSVVSQQQQATNATLDEINRKLTTLERSTNGAIGKIDPIISKQDQLAGRVDQLAAQCANKEHVENVRKPGTNTAPAPGKDHPATKTDKNAIR